VLRLAFSLSELSGSLGWIALTSLMIYASQVDWEGFLYIYEKTQLQVLI
jgi:hypothetical protein